MLEKFFCLKERKTDWHTEMLAGITTFLSMCYILAVNPGFLGNIGMSPQAVLVATALSSALGCLLMGLLANYPIASAPVLGLNAFFSVTICTSLGLPWQFGLLCIFIEGCLFLIISLSKLRNVILDSIPNCIRCGITAGLGLFIAHSALQKAHLIVASKTSLVTFVNFSKDFTNQGICALLCLVGIVLIAVLSSKKIKGAMIITILSIWAFGIIAQLIGIYTGLNLIPSFSSFDPLAFTELFGACFSAEAANSINFAQMLGVVASMLLVSVFEGIGTCVGCAKEANLIQKDGQMVHSRNVFVSISTSMISGAILGSGVNAPFVESISGIGAGARTGLSACTVGLLFLASIVISPIFIVIPSFATAPILVYIAYLMVLSLRDVALEDIKEGFPAILTAIIMPLSFSIINGIAIGIITYVIIKIFTGEAKKIHPMLYAFCVFFVLYYTFMF